MSDLASIVFTLTASADAKLPPTPTRIIHGAFLKWLGHDHPELVKLLHDNNNQRPYTLSNLHGRFEEKNGWLKLLQDETYWYRLTGMEAMFIQSVLTSMRQQERGPQLDDVKLVPGPAFLLPDEHPCAQLSSFAQINETVLQQSERRELNNAVTLRFESPTCFIENKQALPLPLPRYVFGYLANKWQLASRVALQVENLQHFVESIHLSFARIETRMIDLQKYKRTGFVGECRFALHPALPKNYRQALHLLAEFAFFCGVGSHTTMGMGQTRSERR